MDVRTPLGTLLVLILAAIAVQLTIGWPAVIDGFTREAPPAAIATPAPGATTLTVFGATLLPRSPTDARAYAIYAWTGNWPTEPIEASVRLDDRRLGTTPLLDRPLAPGAHELELARAGYLSETRTLDAAPDTAHKASLVMFRAGEHDARARHLHEQAFYHRLQFAQRIALAVVTAFHVLSLLAGLGRRFGRRLALALLHLLLVAVALMPAVRLLVALDLEPWLAALIAGLLLVIAPFALHPRTRARPRT
jgi:hypothetical protein